MGWLALDADAIVHRAYGEPEGAVPTAIASRFGDGVLSADGSVDRDALARFVLYDADNARWLEELVKPLIWAEAEAAVADPSGRGVFLDLPLLFEWGWEERFSAVVAVYAEDDVRMERLRGKGADMDRVAALSALQMGVEEKLERADFVLVNNGDSSLLRGQCAELSRLFSGGDRVAPA